MKVELLIEYQQRLDYLFYEMKRAMSASDYVSLSKAGSGMQVLAQQITRTAEEENAIHKQT